MQNKPNLLDTQMNVSYCITKYYENKRLCRCGEKQTQTKPICYSNKMNTTFLLTDDYEQITMNNEPIKTNPISEESKMSLTHYMTKEYENKSGLLTMEKQTQSNPTCGERSRIHL
jgi:CDGSH-type Zn-finger protein